uniref:WD_REPEATS_REGION domain-containing protein n=2 Tax=Mesocestoides corti TaxID=53468 RepID=A0A5K3FDK2_MESCO
MQNGCVTIRKQDGGELISIERGDGIAILDLEWTYLNLEKTEIFGVCDSSERLSLYQLTGKQLLQTCGSLTSKLALTQKSVKGPVGTKCGKDRYLGFIPMCMNWIGDSSEYLAICGQNQKINLYSYEGCQIGHLTEEKSWILSCKKHPQEKQLVIGCQDGTIRSMQYFTPIVHSFYKDRYAFRDIITDVIIQHLVTEQKARIKCRDVVKKIAIFKNRLAIQLSDRVLIYDSAADDPFDMHYHIKEKVMLKFNCQVLLVASQHIIYCQDCKITCVNFQGQMEHFWCLDSSAQCIQQNGGPDGNESLTIGTTNGQVFKLNLNSAFPILLTKIDTKVSFIDLSSDRDKIAVIDCNNTLTVHSLQTKEILLREANITSAAWNQVINDLLCYTSKDTLHIVTVDYTCHQQPIEGVVVGFNGSSVYCLSSQFVRRIEVQLAQAMYYYLDAGRLKEAYQMARLGVSETDWRKLGNAALLNMELQIARSVFVYLGDYFYLTYIQQLEERQRHGSVQPPDSLMTSTEKLLIEAELACFQGDYKEAAKTFKKANHVERVVGLYTDLRRFTEAKEIMISASGDAESKNGECDFYSEEATRGLLAKHAEWARATKDHRTAATMFIEAGNYGAAIELAAEHGWVDVLLELSRKVDKGDRIHLDLCAKHLAKLGECAFAADCYARIGDVESQLDILIRAAKWDESLSLVQGNPEYTRKVYLPYAQWLAENDSFEEAQAAFARAGLANETVRFLEELASCAVSEFRFDDASWYYWKLSKQCAEVAKGSQDQHTKREYLRRFKDCAKRADVYYVYNNIYRYMKDPFATHVPEAYFNMARYLLQRLGKDDFDGISKVYPSKLYLLFTDLRVVIFEHICFFKVNR